MFFFKFIQIIFFNAYPVGEFTAPRIEDIVASAFNCASSNGNLPFDQMMKCTRSAIS